MNNFARVIMLICMTIAFTQNSQAGLWDQALHKLSFSSFKKAYSKTSIDSSQRRELIHKLVSQQLYLFFQPITEQKISEEMLSLQFSDEWILKNSKELRQIIPSQFWNDSKNLKILREWRDGFNSILTKHEYGEELQWLTSALESDNLEYILAEYVKRIKLEADNVEFSESLSQKLVNSFLVQIQDKKSHFLKSLDLMSFDVDTLRTDYSRFILCKQKDKLGFFQIKKRIGEGNSAHIYSAVDILQQRDVALKLTANSKQIAADTNIFYFDDLDRQFLMNQELSNKDFLTYHEIWAPYQNLNRQGPIFFENGHVSRIKWLISMDLKNTSVANYIRINKITGKELFPLLKDAIAQSVFGILTLKKMGVLHNDIKLENLFMDNNRNIIIGDLDSSIILNEKTSLQRIFLTRSAHNPNFTKQYASPEKIAYYLKFSYFNNHDTPINELSDFYSLGANLLDFFSDSWREMGNAKHFKKEEKNIHELIDSLGYFLDKEENQNNRLTETQILQTAQQQVTDFFETIVSSKQLTLLKEKVFLMDPRLVDIIDFAVALMTPDFNKRALAIQEFVESHLASDLFYDFNGEKAKYDLLLNISDLLASDFEGSDFKTSKKTLHLKPHSPAPLCHSIF